MTAPDNTTKTMNRYTHTSRLAAALLLTLAGASAHAQTADEPALYANITLGQSVAVAGGDARVDFGSGVSAAGTIAYDNGAAGSLAFGREFISENKDDNEEPKHYRLEGELWAGRVQRASMVVNDTPVTRRDAINAQALFVNGLVRFFNGEHYRGWLGAGIGWGRVSVPSAQDAFEGCNCFGEKIVTGLAYRVKLQVQRDLTESTKLFAEVGYIRLPAGSTGSSPSTHYGALGVTAVGIGLEKRF